jgi:hypothetical protein
MRLSITDDIQGIVPASLLLPPLWLAPVDLFSEDRSDARSMHVWVAAGDVGLCAFTP